MADQANPRFEHALKFAADAHACAHHARKGTDFPYIVHPIRVAQILDQHNHEDDTVVAGFLHDTIEDAGVTAEEIAAEFSDRVAELVVAVTEADKTLSWSERKEAAVAHLRSQSDPEALALKAADQLDNLRAIRDCLDRLGAEETWALFNATPDFLEWYYTTVSEILLEKDPESRLFRALKSELRGVFPGARPPATRAAR